MMWFWLVVASGVLTSVRQILNRLLLKDKGDSFAFALFYQAIAAIIVIPFLPLGWKLPARLLPYFLLVVIAGLDAFSIALIMESFKMLEISLRTIIYQLRIFWVLIISVFLLGDVFNLSKLLGVILIFGGVALAAFKRSKISRIKLLLTRILGRSDQRAKGMAVTLLASLTTAFEAVGLKYLLKEFSIPVLMLVIFGIGSLIYLLLIPGLMKRLLTLMKGPQRRLAWLIGLLGTVTAFSSLWSFSLVEISKANSIFQAFTLLTIFGGVVFLKERERIWQKLLGGILTVAGVILVKGS